MHTVAYEVLKALGPLAPIANFTAILGVLYLMKVVRGNDLKHLDEKSDEIRKDLMEYREALQEDINYIRDRLDRLVEKIVHIERKV